MKLTNKLNLPEPIYNAVKNDGYSSGDCDISVTQLIGPARPRVLFKQHEAEITEDCSERIYSLLGRSIHTILEEANATGIAERRLSMGVLGWKISGGMDLYSTDGHLQDYKVTTAWKALRGEVPKEFEEQLNCYAEILRQNNEPVTKLSIVMILRDWSKLEAFRNDQYPRTQVVVMDVPLWSEEKARTYIHERVKIHQDAEKVLPECTKEERWAKDPKFAVKKIGGARAVRVYATMAEAAAHAGTSELLSVEERPGESIKCFAYCNASKFCTQWQEIQKEINK